MRVYDEPDVGYTFWRCDGCGDEYNTEEEADDCLDNGCYEDEEEDECNDPDCDCQY